MHFAKRSIQRHMPAPRPNLWSRSEVSMPKTPTSAKRPSALGITDHDLAAKLKATNERLAAVERKIDQLSR